MKKVALGAVCLFLIILLFVAESTNAQERTRRVRPAFPIGAGEKMLQWTGVEMNGGVLLQDGDNNYWTRSSAGTQRRIIQLPVGTTIKRVLGDFVDVDGSHNITVRLIRYRVIDNNTVELRSFTTSGITSSGVTDYQQVVSNPLSHAMLQGWHYAIEISFPDGIVFGDLRVGIIKLIYEP